MSCFFPLNEEDKQGKSVKIQVQKKLKPRQMSLSGFFYHTFVCIPDSLSHNLGSTRDLFDVVVASEQCNCTYVMCDDNLLNIIDTDVCNIEAIKNYSSIS